MSSRRPSASKTPALAPLALAVLGASAAMLMTGCGVGSAGSGAASTTLAASPVVQGRVMGGQQPVSGATIQLYTVGTTLKGAATPQLTATVTTNASGGFSITGLYNSCPSGAYAYITATGGNPGLSGTVNNTSLAEMTALGPCGTLPTNFPLIQINELTTVAAVYALAPFMADLTHVGAPITNATGLANAFTTANLLVSVAGGTTPGASLPGTSTVPAAEMNTLANVLSLCVNTNGTDGTCSSLYTAAGVATTGSNTVTALLNIAHNPAANVPAIINLAPAKGPFQPVLSGTPSDLTVAITSSGGNLNSPAGLAVDLAGNVWVANSGGSNLTRITPAQVPSSFTGGGLLGPQALAFDPSGNLWVANSSGGTVVKFDANGNLLSGATGYTTGGVTSPIAIAIDAANNVWVANFASANVAGFSGTGATPVAIAGSPFTAGGTISAPSGVAIDATTGNVWITNTGNNTISEISNTGANLSGGTGFSDGTLVSPYGIAINSRAVFVADTGSNTLSVLNSTNGASLGSYSGVAQPTGIATDGATNPYVTTQAGLSIACASGGGTSGCTVGSLNAPVGVAVDASGNVWTANSGSNSVTEFVGLAVPVRTPLVNAFTPF